MEGESIMGKLIICNGKQTEKPYHIKLTKTNIYSIEELCYYIYHNIDVINEEFFASCLTKWISEEVQLAERAIKLQELIKIGAGLKDLVVCILCSADYYSETEIKQLLLTMDEIAKLTPIEKMKKKADRYVKYRQFTEAVTEYENILNRKEAASLTSKEYGNLLHNLAVVQLNTVGVLVAADNFKEAYERNNNIESLKQYLYALKISKQEEKFQQETLAYEVNQELQEQILKYIERSYMEAETAEEYKVVNYLNECKQAGRISQYYQMAEDLINQWKQEFRRENS
jgi:hypothetical protein